MSDLNDDISRLRAFAQDVLADMDGFDGADLEQMALKHGLIVQVTMTEPCGESSMCRCFQYGDFPVECNRKTALFTGKEM